MRPDSYGFQRRVLNPVIGLVLAASTLSVSAETALARVFAAAWQRHPASVSSGERLQASAARQRAADAWTPAPPSLEMGARSDRYHRQQGAEERELGLVVPLWLPGERGASQSLAEAERLAFERRAAALRLQLAQAVRDAWWAWTLARSDAALAAERVTAAGRLRSDVARRHQAGDLSQADLNSAAGALALAEAQAAENEVALAQARYRLQSLSGVLPEGIEEDGSVVESEPVPVRQVLAVDHPQWQESAALAVQAEAEAELARQQTRANPEFSLSTRRERSMAGELAAQTVAVALRLPFGAGARQDARIALARAEALERRSEAERHRERLALESETSRIQVDLARRQLAAAEQRAQLARDNRALYDKSFRLGETDLPARLRIEAETFEAERAAQRARIALALGLSQWRQALGLLPE